MAVSSDRFSSTTSELWQLGNTFGFTASQNNGNITSQITNAGGPLYSTSYGYDVLNRLLTATESGGWVQEYCYDAVGNRAQKSGTALFSAANLVPTSTCTGAFTVPYSDRYQWNAAGHDPAGNQTTLAGRTYTFDAEGRITTATGLPVNSLVAFDYDGAGRRVRKTVGSSVTISVYDAMGNLAAEYENQPAVPPCATCYFTTDHLGSTRVVTDAAGNVVRRYDYAPFGEEIPAGTNGRAGAYRTSQGMTVPDALKEEFTGKERDTETGLDYFGARYMSAAQGRFTSPDKPFVDQHMDEPQSWNAYSYVRNNPLAFVDDDGRETKRSPGVRKPVPGASGYTYLFHANNQNDNPNFHVFNSRGNPIGKIKVMEGLTGRILESGNEETGLHFRVDGRIPKDVQAGIRGLVSEEGIQPRYARTGGPFRSFTVRGGGLLTVLSILTGGVADYKQASASGIASNVFGENKILDPSKAAEALGDGTFVAYTDKSGKTEFYQVIDGQFVRGGCNQKKESCGIPNSGEGSFSVVDVK